MVQGVKWTDERVCEYLQSLGHPLDRFVIVGELYGHLDQDGQLFVWMDDDDVRVVATIGFLMRFGARSVDP